MGHFLHLEPLDREMCSPSRMQIGPNSDPSACVLECAERWASCDLWAPRERLIYGATV
jgi:hypothetical protein